MGEEKSVSIDDLYNSMPNSSGTPPPEPEVTTERERRRNLPRIQSRQ